MLKASFDKLPTESKPIKGGLQKLKEEMNEKKIETISSIQKAKEAEKKRILENFKDNFKTEKKEVLMNFNAKWEAIEKDVIAKNEQEYEEKKLQWGEQEGVMFSPPMSSWSKGDSADDTKQLMGKISKVIPKDGVYQRAAATNELYVTEAGDTSVSLLAGNEILGAQSSSYRSNRERYKDETKGNMSKRTHSKGSSKLSSYYDNQDSSSDTHDDDDDSIADDDEDSEEDNARVSKSKLMTSAISKVPQSRVNKKPLKNGGKKDSKKRGNSNQGETSNHPLQGSTLTTKSQADMLLVVQQQQEWMEKQAEKQAEMLNRLTLLDRYGGVNDKKKKKSRSKD